MKKKAEVSYIIAHNNREELLEYNLRSLLAQTVQDFEIIIVDNSVQTQTIKNLVSRYRKMGLNIKLFFVDPQLCSFSHDKRVFGNLFNPALQQNVGAKKSEGKILVLTSPEVVNASTNVENIIKKFDNDESRFLLGWIHEVRKENMRDIIESGYKIDIIKASPPESGVNNGAHCKKDTWFPRNYFLGSLRRRDFMRVGGIDESFMGSIGFEDDEFPQRCINNSIGCFFEGEIAGIHLYHSRDHHMPNGFSPFRVDSRNARLRDAKRAQLVANQQHDWGSNDYIRGEF